MEVPRALPVGLHACNQDLDKKALINLPDMPMMSMIRALDDRLKPPVDL